MREIRSAAVKLRALRAHRNMTIEELSDRSGVSKRSINRIEAADMVGYNPQLKTIASLSRVFGLTLAVFFSTPVNNITQAVRS